MMIRQRSFRIGQRVKLHDSTVEAATRTRYPGWIHGEEVTVIGYDHGYVRVPGDGKETTVFIVNIDSGWDEQYANGLLHGSQSVLQAMR